MCKKRAVSLLEMMIVIFLISLIGAAIGYNLKGSLDKGKEFKTKESIRQIKDILLLEVANGYDIETVVTNSREFIKESGLAKDVDKLLVDGWGQPFLIRKKGDDIEVVSDHLNKLEDKKKKKDKKLQEVKGEFEF
ncbi:MAG: prepilin-type cleavage/methylation domain-containing protein [Chlamydiae bacterium CG10_big_fil_rev_8_21_14_0_10_35_9]|nr:MAG: prepilin-type cleavage/methylation domain-containing protein [Chlamydiae bacterium CG10_big_fil_rev_8_21_14_0_10_35_9]